MEATRKALEYTRAMLNRVRAEDSFADRRCSVAEEALGAECLMLPLQLTSTNRAAGLLTQGLDFQRREKYAIAIQLFCKSIILKSNRQLFICAHLCRGNLFYELAHYREAERDFATCIAANGRIAVSHFNRGLALKCMATTALASRPELSAQRMAAAMASIETAAALARKQRDKQGPKVSFFLRTKMFHIMTAIFTNLMKYHRYYLYIARCSKPCCAFAR